MQAPRSQFFLPTLLVLLVVTAGCAGSGSTPMPGGGGGGGGGGAGVFIPTPGTLIFGKNLPSGELVAVPAPVSPAENNVGYFYASIKQPTSPVQLKQLPGHLGAQASDLAIVGGKVMLAGASVITDPRQNNGVGTYTTAPVVWSTPSGNPTPLAKGTAKTGVGRGINSKAEIVGILDGGLVLWKSAAAFTKIADVGGSAFAFLSDTDHIIVDDLNGGAKAWLSPTSASIPLNLTKLGRVAEVNSSGVAVGRDYAAGAQYFDPTFAVYWTFADSYQKHKLSAPASVKSYSADAVSSTGAMAGGVTYTDGSTGVLYWPSPATVIDLRTKLGTLANVTINSAQGFLADGTVVCVGVKTETNGSHTNGFVLVHP